MKVRVLINLCSVDPLGVVWDMLDKDANVALIVVGGDIEERK